MLTVGRESFSKRGNDEIVFPQILSGSERRDGLDTKAPARKHASVMRPAVRAMNNIRVSWLRIILSQLLFLPVLSACYRANYAPLAVPMPLDGIALQSVNGGGVSTEGILLVFTGYTRCPDICPATLSKVAKVRALLPQSSARFLFLSVDPEHDDAASLRAYVKKFGGGIEALDPSPASSRKFLELAGVFKAHDAETGLILHGTSVLWVQKGQILRKVPVDFSVRELAEDIENAERGRQ